MPIAPATGVFRAAAEGTLFLDEIGELSLAVQAKLLRAMEEKEIMPVGSDVPIRVNTRVIAATHRNLEQMVESGAFRQDLVFRLNAVEIRVPALRERMEDVPLLVKHFMERHCREAGKSVLAVDDGAMRCFMAYGWGKGNVRELSDVIERAVICCEGDTVCAEFLPANLQAADADGALTLCQAVQRFEAQHIAAVLESVGGDKDRAAQILGISRAILYRHAQKLKPGNHS